MIGKLYRVKYDKEGHIRFVLYMADEYNAYSSQPGNIKTWRVIAPGTIGILLKISRKHKYSMFVIDGKVLCLYSDNVLMFFDSLPII